MSEFKASAIALLRENGGKMDVQTFMTALRSRIGSQFFANNAILDLKQEGALVMNEREISLAQIS